MSILNDQKNQISLDYTTNPALKELFMRHEVGDKCCLEVEFVIISRDRQAVMGVIKSIREDDDYDPDKPSEGGYDAAGMPKDDPTALEPVMMVVRAGPDAQN